MTVVSASESPVLRAPSAASPAASPVSTRRPRAARAVVAAIGLVLILFAAGCGGDDSDDANSTEWTTFTDEASSLSVDLPGEPQTQTLDAPASDGTTIDTRVHLVEFGDSAVAFGIFELPNHEFDLALSMEGAAANVSGEILETTPSKAGDYEALDAEISLLNGEGIGFYRVTFLEDQKVAVQLQSIGRTSDRDSVREAFDTLVASFNP